MVKPGTVLQIVSFLDMFCVSLLMPQMGNHALQLGVTQMLLGTIRAIYSGFQLISEPIMGSFSDLKGRKPILITSLILCGTGYLLLGLASSIIFFFLIRCFLGMIKQTQLLIKALAPDYEKEQEKQAVIFGRLATLSSLSFAVGPVIGGHIMQAFPEYGFTSIAVIVSIIYAINAGLINNLPDVPNAKKDSRRENDPKKVTPKLLDSITHSLKESVEQIYQVDWTIYWDVFVFKLIMALTMGLYFNNYSIYLKTVHNTQPVYLGYLISLQGIVGAIGSYFIGFINKVYADDKDFSKRVSHIFIAMTISLIGMGLAPSLLLYVLFVLPYALAGAVSRIISLEMIVSKGDSERRGSVIGVMGSLRSLSGVVTPLLAGFVGQYFGVTYTFYFAALFTSFGIVASFRFRSRNIGLRSKKE